MQKYYEIQGSTSRGCRSIIKYLCSWMQVFPQMQKYHEIFLSFVIILWNIFVCGCKSFPSMQKYHKVCFWMQVFPRMQKYHQIFLSTNASISWLCYEISLFLDASICRGWRNMMKHLCSQMQQFSADAEISRSSFVLVCKYLLWVQRCLLHKVSLLLYANISCRCRYIMKYICLWITVFPIWCRNVIKYFCSQV